MFAVLVCVCVLCVCVRACVRCAVWLERESVCESREGE